MTGPLSVKEISDRERIHPSTVYEAIQSGTLPAYRFGGSYRIDVESYQEWREGCRVKPKPKPAATVSRLRAIERGAA